MRALTTLAALMLTTPALAADHEIAVELGTLANQDADYNVYTSKNAMPSWGLRGAFAFHDRLAVSAGWHRVRRGADLYAPNSDGFSDTAIGRAAFTANELTLGLRADVEIAQVILPYVHVHGLLLQGTSRFDDDPEDEDSPGQVKTTAMAAGLMPMGGVELRIPLGDAPFTVGWHMEAGYGWVSRLDFDELGDMSPGGFALRSGVGVKF